MMNLKKKLIYWEAFYEKRYYLCKIENIDIQTYNILGMRMSGLHNTELSKLIFKNSLIFLKLKRGVRMYRVPVPTKEGKGKSAIRPWSNH